MANRNYGAVEHQRAFEVYYETRTYAAVQRELDIDFTTVKRWESADYECPQSCPWHNWEKLLEERTRALSNQLDLYDQGIFDPVAHDKAIRDAICQEESLAPIDRKDVRTLAQRQRVVAGIVRSDLEKLSQWEFLWGIIYYKLTGLAVNHRVFLKDGEPYNVEGDIQDYYENRVPLKIKDLPSGIKALMDVQSQIETMKKNLGVYAKIEETKSEAQKKEEAVQEKKSVSIEDIRNIRHLLENTSPEQLALIRDLVKADDAAFDALLIEAVGQS